jgi:folate-binding protein YgfZ
MIFPPSASIYRYRPAAWLRVAGPDAETFLQGQFTNDIRQAGAGVYGLWLDLKGKVLADSFVLRGAAGGEFWVGSYFSVSSAIARRLGDYIIADDVDVEDATALWTGLSLIGDGVGAWLRASPRAGYFFRGRRSSGENWEWILPIASAEALGGVPAGSRELGRGDAERFRILAGIPAVPSDIGPGDLPNEGGLDLDALSYTKGCYLGQEVMARLKSKGRIRRRLHRVSGGGPPPAEGCALWQGGARVGELRSACPDEEGRGFVGIAMLSLARVSLEAPLAPAADGDPTILAAPLLSV